MHSNILQHPATHHSTLHHTAMTGNIYKLHCPKLKFAGLFSLERGKRDLQVAQFEAHAHAMTSKIYTFHSLKLKLAGLFSPKLGKRDLQKRPTSFILKLCKGRWQTLLHVRSAVLVTFTL